MNPSGTMKRLMVLAFLPVPPPLRSAAGRLYVRRRRPARAHPREGRGLSPVPEDRPHRVPTAGQEPHGVPQTDSRSAKLASACSSLGYTSKTRESFVITKMFSIRLSTEHNFIWPPRRT